MNILVYNLAAEYGGALTVLEDFYNEVKQYRDKKIQWYFVVSTSILHNTENITVIQIPAVKKSWFHRWKYDSFEVNKLIKSFKIDKVFSMQNMTIKNCEIEQTVYLHQSLQFSPVKYSLLKKEERSYAIRQKLLCKMIRKSLKKADKIITQTDWMKDATIKWVKSKKPKYYTVFPKFSDIRNEKFDGSTFNTNVFFYPSGDGPHKNHDAIIDACLLLEKERIGNYKIIFTLDKNGSDYSKRLYKKVCQNQLNIEFCGYLSKERVLECYRSSTLIFPSYLETVGYPLLEARNVGCLILASDLPYVKEVLDGYKNVYLFKYNKPHQIRDLIKKCIASEIMNIPDEKINNVTNPDNLSIINVILE
jgi:glycosyltransferase involved in cell wall biosynthesis